MRDDSIQNNSESWVAFSETVQDGEIAGDDESEFWSRLRVYLLEVADRELGSGFGGKLDASDIVQKSMLEIQSELGHFRGNTNNELRGWLKRVVQNNVIDVGRRYRKAQSRDVSRETTLENQRVIAANSLTASSIMRHDETDAELIEAVSKLSERRRQIIELRHSECLSYAEIGNEMGLSDAAARKLYSRAVEELRGLLTIEPTREN